MLKVVHQVKTPARRVRLRPDQHSKPWRFSKPPRFQPRSGEPAKQPKVTLVGAGPGDPDLLTVRGMRALQNADVVLYDALANDELLDYAPATARRVYVGKRADRHRFPQEEINLMIVQHAFQYGHVVRLKGGDSFVFGRGHEEITYAAALGIATEVVPGISSCISLPELQRVPVTRRGVSESFWVLTGTTRSGELSEDIYQAAQSNATAVILMGMRKLRQIAAVYAAAGRAALPVMVIQNGSRENERYVLGTITDIAERAEAAGIGSPGLIVVGEVVGLHPDLNLVAARAQQNAALFTTSNPENILL